MFKEPINTKLLLTRTTYFHDSADEIGVVTIVNNLVVTITFSKKVGSELKPAKSPAGLYKSWMLGILSLFSSQTVM